MIRASVLAVVVSAVLLGGASAQPLLTIAPDSLMVAHNTVFSLDVRVSGDVTSLMGYNIAVTFDSAVLQLQSVSEGSLPLTSGYPTFFHWLNPASADSVHVNGAILGSTVDGPGTVFTLTFLAWAPTGTQTSDVRIAFSVLRDGVNQGITHTARHGWVLVEPPVAVQPVTWGAVKAIYLK